MRGDRSSAGQCSIAHRGEKSRVAQSAYTEQPDRQWLRFEAACTLLSPRGEKERERETGRKT